MGLVTVTPLAPLRAEPLQVTNPAGWVTSESSDQRGRLTAVWTPGHPQAPASPDKTFSYSISDTAASVITTNTISATGGYTASEQIYDSFGRPLETQSQTAAGNRLITDQFYDSAGSVYLSYAPYFASGAPAPELVEPVAANVPSEDGDAFDNAGRGTANIAY